MNYNEYLEIKESQSELSSKFVCLRDFQLQWYESEALNLFGFKKLPARSDDELIQQVLGKSPNDEQKKKKSKDYYVANVIAFLKITRALLDDLTVKFRSFGCVSNLKIYNYHRLLRNLLMDSLVLLNNYSDLVLGQPETYPIGKNIQQHTLTIYQSLRQSIFGQDSFHSFKEIEPDLSISIIRQLIELKVRRAFGILALFKPDTGSIEPLPMSAIFEVIKKYEDQLDVSMQIACLERIYGWSNIFLHSGYKDYAWNHVLVLDYLKEFALGKPSRHDVNSGIYVSQIALAQIIAEMECKLPVGATIYRCPPEANLIIL
ncbi:MAG: hypothetical protein ACLQT6_00805 [Desulfomonilaceae bacterium]